MDYTRITIITQPDLYERTVSALQEMGSLGFEERQSAEGLTLEAYFGRDTGPEEIRRRLADAGIGEQADIGTLADKDWNAEWRKTVQPVEIAEGIWVAPTWRPPSLDDGHRWIRIEPAMAFGTGHHESTRLSASFIREYARDADRDWSMLDIGAGSGILGLCGRLCGAGWCLGVEIDPVALGNAAENRDDNPALDSVGFVIGSTDALSERARFDLIVMNVLYQYSAPLLSEAARLLGPGGAFVWSGLLAAEREAALDAAAKDGFCLRSERASGEWWAGRFDMAVD